MYKYYNRVIIFFFYDKMCVSTALYEEESDTES